MLIKSLTKNSNMLNPLTVLSLLRSGPRPPNHIKERRKAGKDARKLIVGRKSDRREQRGKVEDQEQSTPITHASAVPEWEVLMDQSRFPLSRERAPRGQAPPATSEQSLSVNKINNLSKF